MERFVFTACPKQVKKKKPVALRSKPTTLATSERVTNGGNLQKKQSFSPLFLSFLLPSFCYVVCVACSCHGRGKQLLRPYVDCVRATALQPAVTMATIQMHTQSMMIVSIGHPTIFIFIIWTEKRKERNTLKEPTRTRRPFQPLLYQLHHIRSYDFVLFLKIKKRVLTLGERKRNTFRSERCIHRRPTRCSLSFSFFFFFLFESWRIRFRALWGMFQSIFSLFFIFFPVLFFFSCCVSFVVKALFIPALNYSKLQSWVRARMMAVIITLTLLERKWKKKKHSARETQVGQTIGALHVDHINKKNYLFLFLPSWKERKGKHSTRFQLWSIWNSPNCCLCVVAAAVALL